MHPLKLYICFRFPLKRPQFLFHFPFCALLVIHNPFIEMHNNTNFFLVIHWILQFQVFASLSMYIKESYFLIVILLSAGG